MFENISVLSSAITFFPEGYVKVNEILAFRFLKKYFAYIWRTPQTSILLKQAIYVSAPQEESWSGSRVERPNIMIWPWLWYHRRENVS